MEIRLEFPNEKHKNTYETLLKEWWNVEKIPTSPGRLFSWENFYEFLKIVNNDLKNNINWINAHLYFLMKDKEILWWIQIRHTIEHPNLIEEWWHIWYWIAPKYRKNWYATQMLKLVLEKSKEIWLKKVLLTCDLDNIWSNKVIKSNWWVFERKTIKWDKNRYWININ